MTIKHWSGDAYRKLGLGAVNGDGPWALEANPHRNFSTSRYWRTTSTTYGIYGVVMHITAGMSDYSGADTSADATQRYGATTSRQASWHVCIDSDGISPAIRDRYRAWHAGVSGKTYNHGTVGIEIGHGTTDWRKIPDWWVAKTLRNVAIWTAPRVIKYKIPLRVERDPNKVDAAIRAKRVFGFTQHGWLDPRNRTDAGLVGSSRTDTFPWEQFFGYLREEIARLGGSASGGSTGGGIAMRRGDTGSNVTELQRALSELLYDVDVDGSFGPGTEAAVRQFQTNNSLTVDGIAGPNTLARLDSKEAIMARLHPDDIKAIAEAATRIPAADYRIMQTGVDYAFFKDYTTDDPAANRIPLGRLIESGVIASLQNGEAIAKLVATVDSLEAAVAVLSTNAGLDPEGVQEVLRSEVHEALSGLEGKLTFGVKPVADEDGDA